MLDIKLLRENPTLVQERLDARKAGEYAIQPILDLDIQQRTLEGDRSQLQARSNEIGKLIGQKIKGGADPKGEEIATLKAEGNEIKQKLADLEPQEKELKAQIYNLLLALPNLPDQSTPVGTNETENVEVRRWEKHISPPMRTSCPTGKLVNSSVFSNLPGQ